MKLPRTREWRLSRALSQRALAEKSGVAELTVIRIENGDSVWPSTAGKIADGLDVAVQDLMERPPVPLERAPRGSGQSRTKDPAVPLLPDLSLVALSFEELETRLFGAPVEEQEEPAPALTVEEAHQLVRAVRGERDALEDWLEAYAAAPAEERLQSRADEVRAKERVRRARLYYALLIDYWSKLSDPRGVPFKGVQQFVAETAEARGLMQAIKEYQDELQRLEKDKAG